MSPGQRMNEIFIFRYACISSPRLITESQRWNFYKSNHPDCGHILDKFQIYLNYIATISQPYLSHISDISPTYRVNKKNARILLPNKNCHNSVNFKAIWLKFYIKVDGTFMKLWYFISHLPETLLKIGNLSRNFSIWVCWEFKKISFVQGIELIILHWESKRFNIWYASATKVHNND